jgi:hypothetical protein
MRHMFVIYDQNSVELCNAAQPKCNRIWKCTVTNNMVITSFRIHSDGLVLSAKFGSVGEIFVLLSS